MLKKLPYLLLLLFLGLQISAQESQPADTLTNKLHTFTHSPADYGYVIFKQDTLITLKTNLGPISPKERAELVNHRMDKLYSENLMLADSFTVEDLELYSIVSYKGTPLLSVSDEDARLEKTTRQELIREYSSTLQNAIREDIKNRSMWYWVLHILYTLLTLAGLYVIFYVVNRLFRWIDHKVMGLKNRLTNRITSMFKYLAPRGPEYFISFLLKIVKVLVWILILLLYLPLLFSFLPWTKGLASDFYAFILVPIKQILNGLWLFISQKLIYLILIFYLSKYLLRVIAFVSNEIESGKLKLKGFHQDWAKPTYNIVRILVMAFTIVFMWPYIPGSQSDAFKGVSIFLGILFSLGSTSAIANIVAGIVITYMRPFQLGDRVKIGDTMGDIVEKNLLVTRLKTLKNEDITIPNATIINTHLWNYSKNASQLGVILHTSITIGYDVPHKVVNDLLLKAARNTPNLTREFKPFVLQKNLGDFYIEYELNVYTKQPSKMPFFYSELHKQIVDEFNKAGVEIMSPTYSALRDGNKTTVIPPKGAKKKTAKAKSDEQKPDDQKADQQKPEK